MLELRMQRRSPSFNEARERLLQLGSDHGGAFGQSWTFMPRHVYSNYKEYLLKLFSKTNLDLTRVQSSSSVNGSR